MTDLIIGFFEGVFLTTAFFVWLLRSTRDQRRRVRFKPSQFTHMQVIRGGARVTVIPRREERAS